MVRVYSASGPAEAQLVCGMLTNNGIRAVVEGENLWMARGDVPVGPGTAPSVWVNEPDVDLARQLIEGYEHHSSASRPAWKCPECGEQIEGQFDTCWKAAPNAPTSDHHKNSRRCIRQSINFALLQKRL